MSYHTCCDLFKNFLSVDGAEGLSIVPVNNFRFGKYFRLEFCATPKSDMQNMEQSKDRRVILMLQQAIQYCPFCGTRLAAFYFDKFLEIPHVTETE
jgi:hypothetical protein